MFKLVFKKAEEPEIKLPTSTGSSKKQETKNLSGSASVLREEGLHSPHPGGRGWELEKRAEQALPAVCPREGPKGAEVGAHLITGPFRLTQSYVALLSSVLSSLLPPVPLFLGNADTSLTVGPLLLLQMPLPGPVVPGAHWPIAWGLHPSLPVFPPGT